MASPLEAPYIQRGSGAYTIHRCENLQLFNVIYQLIGDHTYSCDLVTKLCGINLFTFHMKYFRRKRSSHTSIEVFYLDGHPLCETHCYDVHARDVVTIGWRMAYVNKLSPDDIKALRAKVALVLFKPFRSIQGLIQRPTHHTCIGLTLTHEVKPHMGAIDMAHKIGPAPIPEILQTKMKSLR
ncbi:hypothetical protein PHMEG_00019246 [Phytophthora megakarya]|uniref:Uncharacterized protein n=1 Tax=Phytophthora megakarya TaxID=4795 RepID=A0A225VSC7_9STRA|nr:hypothetical protein PHMEG_00019246 [Phytophthora megakarya]